ncbi:MAG: hypothetical protein PHH59_16625 [Methylovulum sp.]|uniref:hypothetical protein n=1 Tax=Methylovulum sp. TaxID=1916980 RepID=UPI0026065359|nr:hypothetical protein [Methylovulum sp.]MDD2725626.1 hypothetical protein [Methylovulum sp.]
MSVISAFCGLLALPFPSLLSGLWLVLGVLLSGIGGGVVSLASGGLFGWGLGRNPGLAFALRSPCWVFRLHFRPVGSGFCVAAPKRAKWVFGFVPVGFAGLPSVLRGRAVFLPVVAAVSGWLQSVVASLGGLGVFRVVRHCGTVGFCGAGQNTSPSMPNKPVKGTARRSGWRSF